VIKLSRGIEMTIENEVVVDGSGSGKFSFSDEVVNMNTEVVEVTPVGSPVDVIVPARKRGRPKGSKNKPRAIIQMDTEKQIKEATVSEVLDLLTPPKKRGRPKGSKNKPKATIVERIKPTEI
jgi:hypothetical protein